MSDQPRRRLRVGVVFGGRSGEHEISLRSAQSVLAALDRSRYEIVEIGIDREGRWLLGGDAMMQLAAQANEPVPASETTALSTMSEDIRELESFDIVFPVLHGPYGEDGTIQGFLEMAQIPYVGAGVAASAVGMDKALMKALFVQAGLPVVPHRVVLRQAIDHEPEATCRAILAELELPLFVKPANLGSSVGISKVKVAGALPAALELAAAYDRKIVVEQGIDAREIEISVLGNDRPEASVPGEIIPHREFYDYAAKYEAEDTELVIPAPLPDDVADAMRTLAIRAFRALDCAGLARVDFLLERATMNPYVSEVNTMPGFTDVSMYPKLWEASGLPYSSLLDRLIELGMERAADRRRNRTVRGNRP